MESSQQGPRILITGASGYVGGRLLHALEERSAPGLALRCLARYPEYLRGKVNASTQVVQGDVLDPASLCAAMEGVETAFYLVPSAASTSSEEDDRRAASAFGEAARQTGVRRIIYLGGLGENHREIGRLLARSGVPTVEFRTFIIIGSGSLSFEMLRALVEKLPLIPAPRWFRTRSQPIAIEDVIAYLQEALHGEMEGVFEIGGADEVSYAGLILEYARARGLRRFLVPVPVMAPRLFSLLLEVITPLYARAVRKVIASLRQDAVLGQRRAHEMFAVRPRGVREEIGRAHV